jgi:hypothetical protein
MIGKRIFLLFILCTGLLAVVNGQTVVNIESKRIVTDTTGWAGSAAVAFNLSKNQKTQFNLASSAHVQFKTKRDLFLLLGNHSLVEAGDEKFVNYGFGHFRYNTKINDYLRWEAFTQIQYNKVLKVENRFLVGMGPRFKVLGRDKIKLYAATIYMYEIESIIDGPRNYDHRLSNYASLTFKPLDNLHLSATYYYQPKLDDFGDYRIAGQANMRISISKKVSFTMSYNYLFDKIPPPDVQREVYALSNGLSMKF